MDLLTAATAHAHSAKLYTRNASDFHGLKRHNGITRLKAPSPKPRFRTIQSDYVQEPLFRIDLVLIFLGHVLACN
jgi:hypothetical protein